MKPTTCPRCGVALSGYAPHGLCPRCLVQAGIEWSEGGELRSPRPSGHADLRPEAGGQKAPGTGGNQADSGARPAPRWPVGSRFGDYALLEEIGHGGMGVVYRARQQSLDRLVALKLLLFGPHAPPDSVKRFRAEAVATAALQHPNIVAIHEVGFCEGQHFIAMECVEGPSLAQLIADFGVRSSDLRRPVRWVKAIAEAVHHAHERGVLHRDLKPSNILIDAQDQPHVVDFGLAKRFQEESENRDRAPEIYLTATGQVLGSPNYMAPEQVSGRRGRVSRRTDVHALGALLYHALTGRPAFVGESPAETMQQVLDADPVSPQLINPGVPRDLATVCLKCLEKEPAKRYPTAQMLADELSRFLEGKPVWARPVGRLARGWRWCRRKPVTASLGVAALALLMVVGVGSPLALYRINQQRVAAVEQTILAELSAYAARINSAQQYLKAGNLGRARELLELAQNHSPRTPDPRGWEWAYLRAQSQTEAAFILERLSTGCKVAVSPDGQHLAVALRYGQVRLWNLPNRTLAGVLGDESGAPTQAFFSPDGHWLSSKSVGPGLTNKFLIWDVGARALRLELVTTNWLGPAVFVPGRPELIGGQMEALTGVRGMALWDLSTRSIRASESFDTAGGDLLVGNELVITPDGELALSGDVNGMVRVWRTRDLTPIGSIPAHVGGISAMALSPDGQLLATAQAHTDTAIRLWDLRRALHAIQTQARPEPRASLAGHEGWVSSLSFSSDGRLLASGSMDHSIRIWDVPSGREMRRLQGHENQVLSVQFAPNGCLYSSGRDGLVCGWSLEAPARPSGPEIPELRLSALSVAPAGSELVAVHPAGTVSLIDLAAEHAARQLTELGADNALAIHGGDGRSLYVAARSGEIVAWDLEQRRATHRLPGTLPTLFLRTSRDGRLLVAINQSREASVWRTSTWNKAGSWTVGGFTSSALSPDGGLLATGREQGQIALWDVATGKPRGALTHVRETTTSLAFSPDGRWLAAASGGGSVTVWESHSLRQVAFLGGHPLAASALAFSPDNRRLATGSGEKDAVKLWDTATWQELLTLEAPGHTLRELAFSGEGTRLVARDAADHLLVWYAPRIADSPVRPQAEHASGKPAEEP